MSGFDDLLKLADTLATYKTNQDKIALNRELSNNATEAQLIINEQQNKLNREIQNDKNILSVNQNVLNDQKKEISDLKKKLSGWNLSYEDHLELPENFTSPDGQAVIDEHTKQFKGRLFENFEAGNDTLDLIQNSKNSIAYNGQILEALNNLEQEYVRGKNFADKVAPDLFIKGIKDGVDLSNSILDYQNQFKADQDMISLTEDEWNTKYSGLAGTDISYDGEMTPEKLNSKWQDWQFITDQTIKYNQDGLPYVVTSGPEASNFIDSPEWKGLMDELAADTALTPTGKTDDWNTNVAQYLQNKIEDQSKKKTSYQSSTKLITDIQKEIGNKNDYIMKGTGAFVKSQLKGIDNFIGTDTNPTIHEDVYNLIQGVVKEHNTITDDWYSNANVESLYYKMGDAILQVVEEGIDYDITPDLIDRLVKEKDVDNLMSVFLYGTTLQEIDGEFGGEGAPFNYFRSTLSRKIDQSTNAKGGLFDTFDDGTISQTRNSEGEQVDKGKALLGKESITYGADNTEYSQNDVIRDDTLDYYFGGSSNRNEHKVLRDMFLVYEMLYDIRKANITEPASLYSNYVPVYDADVGPTGNELRSIVNADEVAMPTTPYAAPKYLQPKINSFRAKQAQLKSLYEINKYNPTELADIDETLKLLQAQQKYYE